MSYIIDEYNYAHKYFVNLFAKIEIHKILIYTNWNNIILL